MSIEFHYSTTPRVNRVTHCKLPTSRAIDWFVVDAIDSALAISDIATATAAIQSNTRK